MGYNKITKRLRSNRLFKGSGPAGAHKMGEQREPILSPPLLASSPSNPHSRLLRTTYLLTQ